MIPGTLVTNRCFLDLYPEIESIDRGVPDDGVPFNSFGIILSPPNGAWIKWMVNGKIGWSNWTFLSDVP